MFNGGVGGLWARTLGPLMADRAGPQRPLAYIELHKRVCKQCGRGATKAADTTRTLRNAESAHNVDLVRL
jgi:hypothetical protein